MEMTYQQNCRTHFSTICGLALFLSSIALVLSSTQSWAEPIRAALFVDRGASMPAKTAFRKELNSSNEISWKRIYGDQIRDGALNNFDVLIVPGGSAAKESYSMGRDARDEVRRFVKEGGIYMGVCAGAYLASAARESYLGLLPLKTLDQEHWYRVDDGTPLNVELTKAGMEVFGLTKNRIRIVYENGPIFAPPFAKTDDSLMPLGFYRQEVVASGGKRGVMLGAPIAILSRYGRGIVLAISPHPEKTPGLKRIELHAIRWLYQHRNEDKKFSLLQRSMICR